jgi:hypothetical protein
MKVKRITLEVEVPIHTCTSIELLAAVGIYLDEKGVPHQGQIIGVEISPNTCIGDVTEFDTEAFYTVNHVSIRRT